MLSETTRVRSQLQSVDEDREMEQEIGATDPLGIFAEINGSRWPALRVDRSCANRFSRSSTVAYFQGIRSTTVKEARTVPVLRSLRGAEVLRWPRRLLRENFSSPSPISIVVEVEEHRFILSAAERRLGAGGALGNPAEEHLKQF